MKALLEIIIAPSWRGRAVRPDKNAETPLYSDVIDVLIRRCRLAWLKHILQKLIIFVLLFPALAHAGETWGSANITSYHTKHDRHLNGNNYGVGAEYHADHDVLLMSGAYHNSYEKTSVYALVGWTPVAWGAMHFGIAVGAINGYPGLNHGGITKAAAGVFRFEGERMGVNLLVIPPALLTSPVTIGLQVKYKI